MEMNALFSRNSHISREALGLDFSLLIIMDLINKETICHCSILHLKPVSKYDELENRTLYQLYSSKDTSELE